MIPLRYVERYAVARAPRQELQRSPGWTFDEPTRRRDIATRIRRAIWQRYHDKQIDRPLIVEWCAGLKLNLRLGTDHSWSVFVGGKYEPNELVFLAETLQDGMTFLDVGANEGIFTLLASIRVGEHGRVLALEPSSREYDRLQTNVELNSLRNIETFELALYDREGTRELTRAEFGHEGHNTLGSGMHNPAVGAAGNEKVRVETLDRFVVTRGLGRLDLVKIDVEGAEARIIDGGRSTLQTLRPLLLLEVGADHLATHGSTIQGLLHLLAELEYRVWIFDESGAVRPRAHDDEPLSDNIVAAPAGVDFGSDRKPSQDAMRTI